MRYLSEALIEDQGLNKLTAELTRIVQTSQRHSAESTARAEQKLQALGSTVETLRGELRTLVHQSQEQLLREVRSLVSEQFGKRSQKILETDALTEQLDRLQVEVRTLARGLRAGGRAADLDRSAGKSPRAVPGRKRVFTEWGTWRFTAPLVALLALSIGYNVWQATRPITSPATVKSALPLEMSSRQPARPQLSPPTSVPPVAAAVAVPSANQSAWDMVWKAALELPLQQCWPQAKSNAKVSSFRDCVCAESDARSSDTTVTHDTVCEWSAKWSAEASVAALQAVLSVAAAKPVTIDARVGSGTFNAMELLVRDCGFKEPALTQAIEELRTTRGKAGDGREPATHQILGFLKKNLGSCR
jgi:hypothetical protein